MLLVASAAGCRGVSVGIVKQDSYAEASPGSVEIVVRNNSRHPLALLSVTLAVGELRMQRAFAAFPRVIYDAAKGEAATAVAEGVEEIGPAARMPARYSRRLGNSSGVLLEHMLMPGDEIRVTMPFTPYPHLGGRVTAAVELIRVGQVYKQKDRMTASQNVARGDAVFIETTTTTIYGRMRRPLGSGQYLMTQEDYDANGRVVARGSTSIAIKPLAFTFTDAARKAGFEPERYLYFRVGGMWLFFGDGHTWFVSPDAVERYAGDYQYFACALERGDEMIEVGLYDEIAEGGCPLLTLLLEGGYTGVRSIVHEPGAGRDAWHLSKSMDSLRGYIRIKDLLQFARDLDRRGYRADGDSLRKK